MLRIIAKLTALCPFSILLFLGLTVLATSAFAQNDQDNQSLGDIARQARAAKSNGPKSSKVVTNDEVPSHPQSGPSIAGIGSTGGTLSPDKQAYCDFLRARKDPAADSGCQLLAIDMGPEYERLTARYIELAKGLCGAGGGHALPTSPPIDPALAAQYREASALYPKFMDMNKAQMSSFVNAESAVNAIQQQEFRELQRDVPDLRNLDAFQANPQEKKRFAEIEAKYKPRIQEKENAAQQVKLRGLRWLNDEARIEHVCDFN
jgi:hypothetical protein